MAASVCCSWKMFGWQAAPNLWHAMVALLMACWNCSPLPCVVCRAFLVTGYRACLKQASRNLQSCNDVLGPCVGMDNLKWAPTRQGGHYDCLDRYFDGRVLGQWWLLEGNFDWRREMVTTKPTFWFIIPRSHDVWQWLCWHLAMGLSNVCLHKTKVALNVFE